jgi:hypothetical protein
MPRYSIFLTLFALIVFFLSVPYCQTLAVFYKSVQADSEKQEALLEAHVRPSTQTVAFLGGP